MATGRSGGDVTYIPQQQAPNPWSVFGQALQQGGNTLLQMQMMAQQRRLMEQQLANSQVANQAQQATLANVRGEQLQADAATQGNIAGLLQQYGPNFADQLDPSVRGQLGAAVGDFGMGPNASNAPVTTAINGKPVAAGGPGRDITQAPMAAKALQGNVQKLTALREIDALEKELSSTEGVLADVETRQLQLSGIRTAKARLQAGEDPTQLGAILRDLKIDPSGRVQMAMGLEEVRNSKNEAEANIKATKVLASQFPDLYGEMTDLQRGLPKASETLYALFQIREGEASQMRIIGARERSEGRLIDKKASADAAARRESMAMTAYVETMQQQLQLLSQDPKYVQNPQLLTDEASNRAFTVIERINPSLAAQLKESGRLQLGAKFVVGMEEARGYVLDRLKVEMEQNVGEFSRKVPMPRGASGAYTAPIRALERTGVIGLRSKEFLPNALDADARARIRQGVVAHLRAQYSIDEGTARLIYEQSNVESYMNSYNQGIIEMRKNPPPLQPGQDPYTQYARIFKENFERNFTNSPLYTFIAGEKPNPMRPETSVEMQNRMWRRILGTNPGVGYTPGSRSNPR